MKNAFMLVGLAAVSSLSGPVVALEPLTVVELFTSQGCSSCPPANANLIEISGRPEILALSFSVTYWDRLGWKDTFGQEKFTDRQRIYEPALGERGPFTPQMVVNGKASIVGNRLGDVEQAIAEVDPVTGPDISLDGGMVSIGASDPLVSNADVWLVLYDPATVEIPVGRGENTGRTLAHTHVVHALEQLGTWTGKATSFNFGTAPTGLRTAVLVQGMAGGPIFAAIRD
jgi:hypothetical protein